MAELTSAITDDEIVEHFKNVIEPYSIKKKHIKVNETSLCLTDQFCITA